MSSRTAAGRKRLQSPTTAPQKSSSGKSPFKLSAFRGGKTTTSTVEGYPSPPLSDAPLPSILENEYDREVGYSAHHPQPLSPQRRRSQELPQDPHPPLYDSRRVQDRVHVHFSSPDSSATTLQSQFNALGLQGKGSSYPSPPLSSSSSFTQSIHSRYMNSSPYRDTVTPTSDLYSESSSSDSGSTLSRSTLQFPEPPGARPFASSSGSNSPALIMPSTSGMEYRPSSTPETAPVPSSEQSQSQVPAPFVFPTTRSRAHPRAAPDGPRIRFGRKKKDKGKGKGTEPPTEPPPTPGYTSSNPPTPTTFTFSDHHTSPISPTSTDSSSGTISLQSQTTSVPSTKFVFPSSRSRAHPSSPPIKFKSRKKAKNRDELVSEPLSPTPPASPPAQNMQLDSRTQRFMGIPLSPRRRNQNSAWRDVPILDDGLDVFSPSSATASYLPVPITQNLATRQNGAGLPNATGDVSIHLKLGHVPGRPRTNLDESRPLPAPPYHIPLSGDAERTVHASASPPAFHSTAEVVEFTYPFDSYDPALMESDKHTHALLQRLISLASMTPSFEAGIEQKVIPKTDDSNPSFCNYGHNPPSKALDLGCGAQGLWVRQAAMKWGGYGTVVYGMDIVDVETTEEEMGPAENGVKFIKGNFITQPLPFPNESFDLVRLANLTYAIPVDKWEFVLQEVRRVLTIGGRLELIDDHVFWPYGKTPIIDGDEGDRRVPDSTDGDQSESDWKDSLTTSQSLELLFERLMNERYGIHLTPSNFVQEMMQTVMGHARELKTMHLTLAMPELEGVNGDVDEEVSLFPESDILQTSPGLVLWPSTLLPMSPHELQAQALKHARVLLASRDELLQEYMVQMGLSDEHFEVGEYEEYREEVWEALREYEGFLHRRFSAPFPSRLRPVSRAESMDNAPTPTRSASPTASERTTRCRRNSISGWSVSSIATDERSAMLDYQSEMQNQFSWSGASLAPAGSPPLSNTSVSHSRAPDISKEGGSPGISEEQHLERSVRSARPTSIYTTRTTRTVMSTAPPDFSSALSCVRVPSIRYGSPPRRDPLPEYSIMEPTLVRTFHVYEGIKLDRNMLAVMRGESEKDNF